MILIIPPVILIKLLLFARKLSGVLPFVVSSPSLPPAALIPSSLDTNEISKEDTIYYLTSGENEKVEITLESTISNIGIKGFGIGGMSKRSPLEDVGT